jgi:hypothetical protein
MCIVVDIDKGEKIKYHDVLYFLFHVHGGELVQLEHWEVNLLVYMEKVISQRPTLKPFRTLNNVKKTGSGSECVCSGESVEWKARKSEEESIIRVGVNSQVYADIIICRKTYSCNDNYVLYLDMFKCCVLLV